MEVCVGEPAKLRCRVEGDPVPDIEWFVDGDKIKKGGRFDFLTRGDLVTLKISETSAEDEGEYKCTATNENGTATTSAELIVNGKEESENICDLLLFWLSAVDREVGVNLVLSDAMYCNGSLRQSKRRIII